MLGNLEPATSGASGVLNLVLLVLNKFCARQNDFLFGFLQVLYNIEIIEYLNIGPFLPVLCCWRAFEIVLYNVHWARLRVRRTPSILITTNQKGTRNF